MGASPRGREVAALTSSCASGLRCLRVPSFTGCVNLPPGIMISLTLCARRRSPPGCLAYVAVSKTISYPDKRQPE
eukprot:9007235-Pyramimonas_sp.AAC.1